MWITFVGDIACPTGFTPRLDEVANDRFGFTVVNFEGPLVERPEIHCQAQWPGQRHLYNSSQVEGLLSRMGVRVASLANNHITDCRDRIGETRRRLTRLGVSSCGAGRNLDVASQPAVVDETPTELVFLAFGWEPIECVPASDHGVGVCPLRARRVFDAVTSARTEHPDAAVILLMHWNYELERYPQPMHRRLAHKTIELGANAVVGHHPHIPGGAEMHRGAPIVYSLGNWCLPQGGWFGARIEWPEAADIQLAFQWNVETGEARFQWYDFDVSEDATGGTIAPGPSETLEGRKISELTPFRNMSHTEYDRWFRSHRNRGRGLPIYYHWRQRVRNEVKDRWIQARGQAAYARLGLQEVLTDAMDWLRR